MVQRSFDCCGMGPIPLTNHYFKSNPSQVPTALLVIGSCSSAEYPLIACHSQTSWFFFPDGDIKLISSDVITITQLTKLVGTHNQGWKELCHIFFGLSFWAAANMLMQSMLLLGSLWGLCILQASRNNPYIDWNDHLKGDQK